MSFVDTESSTPKEHVKKARKLASKISKIDGVEKAHVDDWGIYSNFQIAVLIENKRVSKYYERSGYKLQADLRSVRPKIKKILKDSDFNIDQSYGGIVTPDSILLNGQDAWEKEYGHDDNYIMAHFRY